MLDLCNEAIKSLLAGGASKLQLLRLGTQTNTYRIVVKRIEDLSNKLLYGESERITNRYQIADYG